MRNIIIDNDSNDVRLDRILRKELPHTPLSLIYSSLRKGAIRVNGKKVKQQYRVTEGDIISVNIVDLPKETIKKVQEDKVLALYHTEFFKQNFNLLFEDESLLVCNKPSGLVVHGGTGHTKHDTLIDLARSYVRYKSKEKNAKEPQLVHRLDRDTSGVILIAKNKRTLRTLNESLRKQAMTKQYVALCHGMPPEKTGTIDLSLVKTFQQNSGTKMSVGKSGVQSLSSYKLIKTRDHISKMVIDLLTGKTHQIRVHLNHIGCPILGDVRYGDHELDIQLFSQGSIENRLYLHAEQITLFHPDLNREVTFSAPLPHAFNTLLR